MTDPSETSLRESLEAAVGGDSDVAQIDTPVESTEPLVPELPPLEAPSVWGAPYKDAFSKLATNAEQRTLAEAWHNQWKEHQGYTTRKEQEFADYRKRLDPIYERIAPYEQYWRQQGMEPAQGLSQIMSYAEALANNPQETLVQLAEMYGVDLGQLIAEQPYVDPEVQALKRQLQEVQQGQQSWAQQQQQQAFNRLQEELKSFETATDEKGNLKYPHYDRVFDRMVGIVRGGLAQNIQDAYEMAVVLDKDLQAEVMQKRAQDEAAAQAAAAKKALEASRSVKGKSTSEGEQQHAPLRQMLGDAFERARS